MRSSQSHSLRGPGALPARPHHALLHESLRSGSIVLSTMLALLVVANWLGRDTLPEVFLDVWSGVMMVLCLAHWLLVWGYWVTYHPLGEQALQNHRWWLHYLRWAPSVAAMWSVVLLLAASRLVEADVLAVFSVLSIILVFMSGEGWSAINVVHFFVMLGGHVLAWLLHGGSDGMAVSVMLVISSPNFSNARSRAAHMAAERRERRRFLEELEQGLAASNAQLQTLIRHRGDILDLTSEELRQPVHALGMVLEDVVLANSPTALSGRLPQIRQLVSRLGGTLVNVMDLAQLESGIFRRSLAPVELHGVAYSAAVEARTLASIKHQHVQVDLYALRGVKVNADGDLFRRMMMNLLSYGIRVARDSATLQVRAARTVHGDLQLSLLLDLPPATLEQPLRGIALPMVEKGAALLGWAWREEVLDNPPRCCYTLSVPRLLVQMTEAATAPVKPAEPAQAAEGARPLKIILAEDDVVIAQATTALLRQWGHDVECVEDVDAMRRVMREKDFEPDLVVSDYHLAHGDNGLALIAQAREALANPALPAIVISGSMHAISLGPDAEFQPRMLLKPLRPQVLRGTIQSLVNSGGPQ